MSRSLPKRINVLRGVDKMLAEVKSFLETCESGIVDGRDAVHLVKSLAAEVRRLTKLAEGWEYQARKVADDLAAAEDELKARRDREKGEVWYWQGDDTDEPESLTCPVLMRPEHARGFAAEVRRLREALQSARFYFELMHNLKATGYDERAFTKARNHAFSASIEVIAALDGISEEEAAGKLREIDKQVEAECEASMKKVEAILRGDK
jgi:hypothetical protein